MAYFREAVKQGMIPMGFEGERASEQFKGMIMRSPAALCVSVITDFWQIAIALKTWPGAGQPLLGIRSIRWNTRTR